MLTLAAGPDVLSTNSDNNDFWDWTVTKAKFQTEGHWDGDSGTWDTAWEDYWTTGPGAAYEDLSFMRGNINWFLGASQEAMATQANHHWAHAEARLIGAIDRYKRGEAQGIEPMKANITEVLTFLDWISCGMNKIVMQDTKGVDTPYDRAEYLTTHAWVERDENGYITKVSNEGRTYEFAVDSQGIVTALVDVPAFQSDDEVSVIHNTPNLIHPLDNDQNNGGTLSIDSFTQPSNGTITDEGDGILIYTPDPGYTGDDSFTYSTGASIPSSTVSISVTPATSSQSGILQETRNGISGTAVSKLTGHPNFPHNPDASEIRTLFESPTNRGSTFGTRMTALLIPPTTGDYTFWIATDEGGELWLGDDRTNQGKSLIGSVSGYAGSREWTKFTSQQSSVITLQAGVPYYIEALQKENSGGDNLAVAWQGPGITQEVITNTHLQTIDLNAPTVANAINDVTVVENAIDQLVDLSSVFTDTDLGDEIDVIIMGANTNSSLVSTSLVGDQLTLSFATDQIGSADITVRGADLGGALVSDTFTVTVTVTVQADNDGDGDPDITDPDDDNDSIPDDWENTHGLNQFVDDSGVDLDGDGLSNLDEFLLGTDPNDPSSAQILSIISAPGTGEPTLKFQSLLNRNYTVEYHNDLSTGIWQNLVPAFPGDGNLMSVPDSTGLPKRFYRLLVELP